MAKVDILISSNGSGNPSNIIPGGGGASNNDNDAIVAHGTGNSRNIVARSVYVNQLINAGKSALRSTFNIAKSNYGNFTGDYIGQQKIDNAFSVANTFTSVGSSLVGGFIAGGPVGAAVAAVVSSVSLGLSAWENNINYNKSILKANFNASFNASRLGTILSGGNR